MGMYTELHYNAELLSSTPVEPIVMRPLFVPLKSQYYEAFIDGLKDTEYRKYGNGWNERTCVIGRRVTISKGYGKQNRRTGKIVGFSKRRMASKSWIECYGEPGLAACIKIELDA